MDFDGGGFQQMLSKAMEAKNELERIRRETASRRVTGDAGGGAVKVEATGGGAIISVTIDPLLIETGDVEMLQDMITAAVNVTLRRASEMMEEAMGQVAAQLGLPPGMGL